VGKLFIFIQVICVLISQEAIPEQFVSIINNFKNVDSANLWGTANKEAPDEVKQYGQLAGLWAIKTKNMDRAGKWSDGKPAFWVFKYILDGFAVQDLYLQDKGDGTDVKITQIRQFDLKIKKWTVAWINTVSTKNGSFISHKEDDAMIMIDAKQLEDPKYRVVFKNMSAETFVWEYQIVSSGSSKWLSVAIFTATKMAD